MHAGKSDLAGHHAYAQHLEVDSGIGLRGLDGVMPLVAQYAWAIVLQICVFPQEGLLNNPGTDELIVAALDRGCGAIGGVLYTDSDPSGQIDRIFTLAHEYDVDIDFHLDFGETADGMQLEHVCRRTEEFGYCGRVAVGHVTRAVSLSPPAFEAMAKRLADAGVALIVRSHKSAVRFPFLDYSTLDRRRSACEAELAVNAPYAPEIYCGVVPITARLCRARASIWAVGKMYLMLVFDDDLDDEAVRRATRGEVNGCRYKQRQP